MATKMDKSERENMLTKDDGEDIELEYSKAGNIVAEHNAETKCSQELASEENGESRENEKIEEKEETTINKISVTGILSEFNLKTLYTDRDKQEMAKTAAMNLTFGALPTCADVYTDVWLFSDYLYGTVYKKSVDTLNHRFVNSSQCTLHFKTSVESWTGGDWEEEHVSYGYSCFEDDPIFAWFTLAFIFLPGLGFAGYIFKRHLETVETQLGKLIVCVCFPLIAASWPFVLILGKFVAIFHPGQEFKKLCIYLSVVEGRYEASPQLCLQVFILFSRGDRSPSVMQCAALVTSFIVFAFPQIKDFNSTKPAADELKEEIRRIVQLLPLFVATGIFRILSMAIVCVLLRYYAFFYYGAVYVFFWILAFVPTTHYLGFGAEASFFTVSHFAITELEMKRRNMTSDEKERCNVQYKQFHMIFWFILNTITLVIFLFICNSYDVNFKVFGSENSWRGLPIVSNIILINCITAFTLFCGVFSLILFFLQVN